MDYELLLSEDKTYVIARVHAPMTTELACKFGPELVQLAGENNVTHYLFDVRDARNEQSVTDNYYFANADVKTFDFPQSSVSAFLVTEGDDSHDFITTVFLNAGYVVKIFYDDEAAVEWLANDGQD